MGIFWKKKFFFCYFYNVMLSDYIWTFNIGCLRVGWHKTNWGWTLNKEPGMYFQLGRLEMYIPLKTF